MVVMAWYAVSDMSWVSTDKMCDKTVFIHMLFFAWSTLIAQIILTARIYAITMKNPIVTGVFTGHREMEIAFTAISLVYGSLFPKYSISTHFRGNRFFGISGDRYSCRQIRVRGHQDVAHPSDNCSRHNYILHGYLYVSLCVCDDATIGEANSSALARRREFHVPPRDDWSTHAFVKESGRTVKT